MKKWEEKQLPYKAKDSSRYNAGILGGSITGNFVLDINMKDNRREELDKYVREHGEPDTLTINTPSGGKHYYFNLIADKKDRMEDIDYLLRSLFTLGLR